MVNRTSSSRWSLKRNTFRRGYTILELVVVLAVIGVIATIAFFGFGSFNKTQFVIDAQSQFLGNLRAAQNQVRNGASGSSVRAVRIINATSYSLPDGTVITLPNGVTLSPASSSSICFTNSNLAQFAASPNNCGTCTSGSTGFVCNSSSALSAADFTVTFTNGSSSRSVIVRGTGMNITRIDTK